MQNIIFTELHFAGRERKHNLSVEEWRATKNQNGTYNVLCTMNGERYIFNDCTYPKIDKNKEKDELELE